MLESIGWFTGNELYDTVLSVAFGYVVFVVIASFFAQAPYGRFASEKYGLSLSPRFGWFLMELPATLVFVYCYFQGKNSAELVPLVFLAVWLVHYGNRGFIFPLLIRAPKGAKGSFSLMVILSGWLATGMHGFLNATYISELGTQYTNEWLTTPQFIIGISLYYTAFFLNLHSDHIIRNLRTKEEVRAGVKNYRIPHGGLYRYVTSPSYLTELVGWLGFAIALWSWGSVFILAISAANLIPRALESHRWYKDTFESYPEGRKALIPYLI